MDKNEIELNIRTAVTGDMDKLYEVARQQGDRHEAGYFERCLAEQSSGNRTLFVAAPLSENYLYGYVQLIWHPIYAPFRALDIPEIQDLAIIPDARRQGLGEKLVLQCEIAVRAAGKTDIGIGVGLHARFGAAQRLYVRMGYMPDGAGVVYDDDVPVNRGDLRPVDDLLTLKLVKPL